MDYSNPNKEEKDAFFGKLRALVVSHEANLQKMEQVFNEKWDITVWDARSDVAELTFGQPNATTTVADTLGRSTLNNRLFYCMSMQMGSLVLEMKHLAEECHTLFIPPLCLYGDASLLEEGVSDEDAQRGLGKIMPLLQDVWNWIRRVEKVVGIVMQNLGSLYSPIHQRDNYFPYTVTHFPLLWYSLTDLLAAVVALEEVFHDHDTLRQGIHVFYRLLHQISKNYDKYDADEFHVEEFGKLLRKLEGDLLSDTILSRVSSQMFDTPMISVHSNNTLFAEFNAMLSNVTRTVDKSLGSAREGESRRRVMGVYGLFFLHHTVFKQKLNAEPEAFKKLAEPIFALHTKAPVVFINGLVVWKPAQWLARMLPLSSLSTVTRDPVKESMLAIKAECTKAAAEFVPKMNFLTTAITVWISQMASTYPSDRNHARQLISTITQLLLRGVQCAQDLSKTIKNVIYAHLAGDLALTKTIVEGILLGVQQLVMMRNVLHDRTAVLASTYNLCIQLITFTMNQKLFTLHSKLNDVLQTAGESVTDQHAALGQSMVLLGKPQTPQNLILLDIVLSIAFQRRDCHFEPNEYESIFTELSVLNRLVNVQKQMKTATNCDFLYFQREGFFPIFFESIYANPSKSEFLPYLVQALHDCRPTILSAKHTDSAVLLKKYVEYVTEVMGEAIVGPLCTEVENDLRLHTHGAILGQPFSKIEKRIRDPSKFTALPPIRFFDEWKHIAAEVEKYLDVQFYNLNALMTNDWKTYEEMRNLARERYGLQIAEGYLPGSIVDQGLDVLVITKNIQVFVAQYSYNMNEQLFVQRPAVTESKHLSTLHTRHVANSIRTHGTGIMNTTVNYVYKCLLKKLAILSQFLFDEHVKSRLLKDIKFFNTNKAKFNNQFPIQRAEKFANDIKKLGVTEDGRSCLDQFRQLVAEIGNALGYMRMVRSGGLRAIADAAVFIPSFNEVPRLEKFVNPALGDDEDEEDELTAAVRKAKLGEPESDEEEEEEEEPGAPQTTVDSVRIVDDVVKNMNKRLAQGSDYFRMLEEGISRKLNDEEKYAHLRNFYMIIPSLCMLHVEFMIRQKEQLVKKNKEGLFTDDGFALGCVFLLSLFGVFESYESLHWFEAVTAHFRERQADMQAGIDERKKRELSKKKDKSKKNDDDFDEEDDDLKTMQLTLTMVDSSLREYAALDNAFASSRVFFRYHTEDDDDEEEEEEDD